MTHIYEILADLLEYPDGRWGALLDHGKRQAEAESPELMPAFEQFYQKARGESLDALQERYTQTFDLNPVCTLEVGYHLFGESYKRGLFLANLHETEAAYDLGQQRQLPDHLPVLLRLLVKLEDAELKGALIRECIRPALEKMKGALCLSENTYSHLIEAVARALDAEAGKAAQDEMKRMSELPELYRISSRAAKKEQHL